MESLALHQPLKRNALVLEHDGGRRLLLRRERERRDRVARIVGENGLLGVGRHGEGFIRATANRVSHGERTGDV